MKVLMLVCALVAVVGAGIVACGPQQRYCPEDNAGLCHANADGGSSMPDLGLGGDATILGTD